MRKGFNLPFTIFLIVVAGLVASLWLKVLKVSLVTTVDTYHKKQALLFLKSSFQHTIFKLQTHNRQNGCLKNLTFTSKKFTAQVEIKRYYFFNGVDNDGMQHCEPKLVKAIKTPQSNGYVLFKIVVTSKETPKTLTPIRITRTFLERL
ncbi:MAG: hypothetical protein GXO61_06100 [Epsilonproteobacteria bacterium]|nr:hypothetical protein [Campylobacterota bacterium]